MSRYLFGRLRDDESLEKVYFNETGGWSLNEDNNHKIVKTRQEVLESESDWIDPETGEGSEEGESMDVTEYLQNLENEKEQLEQEKEGLTQQVTTLSQQLEEASVQNSNLLKEIEKLKTSAKKKQSESEAPKQ